MRGLRPAATAIFRAASQSASQARAAPPDPVRRHAMKHSMS